MGESEKNVPDVSRAGVVAGVMVVAALVLTTIPFAFMELKRNSHA